MTDKQLCLVCASVFTLIQQMLNMQQMLNKCPIEEHKAVVALNESVAGNEFRGEYLQGQTELSSGPQRSKSKFIINKHVH